MSGADVENSRSDYHRHNASVHDGDVVAVYTTLNDGKKLGG